MGATRDVQTTDTNPDTTDRAVASDPRVERSKAKVMEAVLELMTERGPRGVTVDAVAEQSGVAKSTIYRHWSSRAELVTAVIRRAKPAIEVPPTDSFGDALRAVMHQVADALSCPQWSQVFPLMAAMRQTMPDVAEMIDEDHRQRLEIIAAVLALGVAEGRLEPDIDPLVTLYLLGGPLIMATVGGRPQMLHELADRSVDQFLAAHPAG